MAIVDYCTGRVETLRTDATAAEAARVMLAQDIGSVVVESQGAPPGIVTDRDLVVRVLAEHRDPKQVRLADIAVAPAVTLPETASVAEAAALMREHAVRRLPIVGPRGEIVGIVTLDDFVELLGRELADLAAVMGTTGRAAEEGEGV